MGGSLQVQGQRGYIEFQAWQDHAGRACLQTAKKQNTCEHLLLSMRTPVLILHSHNKGGIAARVCDLKHWRVEIGRSVQVKRQASDLVRPCLEEMK